MVDTDDDFADFMLIPGIGRAKARALFSAGYRSLDDLSKADVDTLSKIPGIGKDLATRILEFVKLIETATTEDKKETHDTKSSLFICPMCGSMVGADSKKCPVCGIEFTDEEEEKAPEISKKTPTDYSASDGFGYDTDTPPLYLCPECGSLISKNAGKCEHCGAVFSPEEAPNVELTPKKDEKPGEADGFWYKDETSLFLCPNCGAFILKDAKKCKTCGVVLGEEKEATLLPEITKCPNCGEALDSDYPLCHACGFQFNVKKKEADGFWYKERTALFVCPNCGAFISEGAEQCNQCGIVFEGVEEEAPVPGPEIKKKDEEFEHSLYLCETCGAFISSTADKCSVCGTSVEEGEKAPEEPDFIIPKKTEDISAEIAAEIEEIEAETLEAPKKPTETKETLEEKPKRGISKDFLTRWKKTEAGKWPVLEEDKKSAPEPAVVDIGKELGLDMLLVPETSDEERLNSIDSGLDKEPGNYNLWEEKAGILDSMDRKDEAVACLDRAAELNPEKETEYKKKILAILGVGIQKDLEDITELLSLDMDGKVSVKEDMVKENTEKLLAEVSRKLVEKPNEEALWVEKGELLEKLGRPDEAIECFDRSIMLSYSDMEKETEGMTLTPKMLELSIGLRDGQGRVNGRVNGLPVPRGLINGMGRINGLVNGRGRTNGLKNGGLINGLVRGLGRTNGLVNGRGRTNGLVNGGMINGLVNGRGRTNGLINGGLINGLGLVNGEGMINGRGRFYASRRIELSRRNWRYRLSWIVILIALVLIVPMFSNMMTQPKRGIAIDGNFADWSPITSFYDSSSDQIYNPDLNIIESKVVYGSDRIDLFLQVEGTALGGRQTGNITNMADSILIFVDADSDPGTGYIIENLGADLLVDAWGWDNNVYDSPVYAFRSDAAQNDWGGFSLSGSAPCTAENDMIELRIMVPMAMSAAQNPKLLAVVMNSIGQRDFTDFVISETTGSIVVNSHGVGPDVLAPNGQNLVLARLETRCCSVQDSLQEMNFTILGNSTFTDLRNIRLFNDSSSDGTFDILDDSEISCIATSTSLSEFNIRFNTPFMSQMNRCQAIFVVADLAQSASSKTLGLKLNDAFATNSFVSVSNLGTVLHNIGLQTELSIDGAFGDWANLAHNADRTNDIVSPRNNFTVINRNIDLAEARLGLADSLFIYFSVNGVMLGGSEIPTLRFRPGPPLPAQLADTDQDSVPDIIDGPFGDGSMAFDFDNDGVNNSQSNGDFDDDGMVEYPRGGNDYWLNTTIPPDFPANYSGKTVSVYVGPIGHIEICGEERGYVMINSDADTNTGTSVRGGAGIDYVVTITGKANGLWSSQLFRYDISGGTMPWLLVGNVSAAIDWYRLEMSVNFYALGVSPTDDLTVFISMEDCLGHHDWLDTPLPPNALPLGPIDTGTRSPAGDNVVINEFASLPDNNEWIELCNPTGSTINIGGWILQIDTPTGWRALYTFPAGTSIGAWGSGSEYWLVTEAMLQRDIINSGSTIKLRSGGTVDQTTYTAMSVGQTWARFKNDTYGMPTDTDTDANDWYISNNSWYSGNPLDGPTPGRPNDVRRPVISISKVGNTSLAMPGTQMLFTVFCNNTGDGRARSVWINDTLPSGLTYVSSSIPYSSVSGSTYTWLFSGVSPGTFSFTIIALVDAGASFGTVLTNLAELNYTDQLNRAMEYKSATWNVTVSLPQPFIAVSKDADKIVASPGDTITYIIYYNNTGNGPAGNVWINDTLPAGIDFVSSDPPPNSTAGQTQYWQLSGIGPGVRSLTLVASVSPTASPGNVLTNTATCSYTDAAGQTMPGNSDSFSITIIAATARIVINEISSRPNPEWIELCNPTDSSVDLSNWQLQMIRVGAWTTIYTFQAGDSIAAWGSGSEYLVVNLPDNTLPNTGTGVRLVSSTLTEIDQTEYPAMASDQTWSRLKHEDSGKPLDTNNIADWYESNGGWVMPEGPTPATPNTRKTPIMWVNKTVDKAATGPGDALTYTIWYNNSGDGNAKNVWVNDTLPTGVSYVSASIPYSSVSGSTYSWYLPSVTHDSTNSFTVSAIVDSTPADGSTLTNMATCDYTDQLGAKQQEKFGNASSVYRRPIITVEKVADRASANASETITYTIYYNNTGTGNAGSVWINDTLPQWIDYISSSVPYSSVNGKTYTWVFTNVVPGSHSFTITAQVSAIAPSHDATNWANLSYTSVYDYGLAGSSDLALVVIPEFQNVGLSILGLLALAFIVLKMKKKEGRQ